MNSNAFESLHTLPGFFSAVSASLTGTNEIRQYIASIEAARGQCLDALKDSKTHFSQISVVAQVPLPEFFIDCAAVITVSSALQRALSNHLQSASMSRDNRISALPQEETHLLVDLWGQVEASRALFEFVLRQSEQAIAGQSLIKAASLRAQYRVLLSGLEHLILEIGTRYGERLTMADAAIVVDWCLGLVRLPAYAAIGEAVDTELSTMNA